LQKGTIRFFQLTLHTSQARRSVGEVNPNTRE
jgi:hypothetical protein